MSDPLEETISLSDMTEITETVTEDPRATQYGSTSVTHRRIGDRESQQGRRRIIRFAGLGRAGRRRIVVRPYRL